MDSKQGEGKQERVAPKLLQTSTFRTELEFGGKTKSLYDEVGLSNFPGTK